MERDRVERESTLERVGERGERLPTLDDPPEVIEVRELSGQERVNIPDEVISDGPIGDRVIDESIEQLKDQLESPLPDRAAEDFVELLRR